MKFFKSHRLLSIILAVLVVAILGIGVYAAASWNQPVAGTGIVTVNPAPIQTDKDFLVISPTAVLNFSGTIDYNTTYSKSIDVQIKNTGNDGSYPNSANIHDIVVSSVTGGTIPSTWTWSTVLHDGGSPLLPGDTCTLTITLTSPVPLTSTVPLGDFTINLQAS
jgi:hypothetical protein